MILESFLAYFHLVAIFTMVVFMASEAAMCRSEWMNAAVVHRLVRLDLIYGIAALCVLLAGLARTFWGFKGAGWYWSQPLLHFKIAVFIVIGLMSLKPTFSSLRCPDGPADLHGDGGRAAAAGARGADAPMRHRPPYKKTPRRGVFAVCGAGLTFSGIRS